jgi:hypothetical protein
MHRLVVDIGSARTSPMPSPGATVLTYDSDRAVSRVSMDDGPPPASPSTSREERLTSVVVRWLQSISVLLWERRPETLVDLRHLIDQISVRLCILFISALFHLGTIYSLSLTVKRVL